MAHDLLSEYQDSELKRLARFSLSRVQLSILLGVAAVVSMTVLGALFSAPGDPIINAEQRLALERSNSEWALELAHAQELQADWLTRRGVRLEQNVYARISFRVLQAAQALVDHEQDTEPSRSSGLLTILLGAVLRIGFVVIASVRLILAFGVWAWWSSRAAAIPYKASDALGQTGNGRLFFSGIRVDLDQRDVDGSPARQVAGLACPERTPASVANSSKIAQTLKAYGAANPINLALTAIILRYRERPDHVPFAEDEAKFEHTYESGALGTYVEALISAVLSAHREIVHGQRPDLDGASFVERSGPAQPAADASSQILYGDLIGSALGQILSPRVRSAMAAVSTAEVATLCLTLEAGKILLFVVEGGKWNRRSHFPELSARAVLHSCPEFSETYSAVQRTRLRRALVFSGEPSVFAPIRLPQDLTPETRALLGFSRMLLAQPHELPTRAANEELQGILAHVHFGFERLFFATANELDPDLLEGAYAASNVLMLKLTSVMTLLRQVIDPTLLARLHELVALVHEYREEKAQSTTNQEEPRTSLGSHDVILPALREEEMNALATLYKVSETDMRDWAVLRLALHHFGWLGRRVSERTVPGSSIVFVVLKADPRSDALTGVEGVVPLRASRCREHWGKQWASRFIQVEWARIAESRRDYERLLSGEISDALPPDAYDADDAESGVGN